MKTELCCLMASALLCSSCSPFPSPEKEQPKTHQVVELNLSAAEQALTTPTNEFVLHTFKEIAATGETNAFVSPLSAAFVLSMLSNGAEGNTLAELQAGLGYQDVSLEAQNTYFNKLITALPYQDSTTIVEFANALFIDEKFPVYEDFKTTNANYYLAMIENLPMRSNSGSAAATINRWCAEKTHDCIREIVKPAEVQEAIMAVCNAIYFKGYWKDKFLKEDTRNDVFHAANGDKTVAFMHQTEDLLYAENEVCQFVSLTYGDGRGYSLDIILPREGVNAKEFVQNFTTEQLSAIRRQAQYGYDVVLSVPKFKVEYSTDLIPAMNALGIQEAFTDKANFAKISEFDTYIQAFKQKAYIAVDEDGTEAAAVTVGMVGCTSAGPGEIVVFNANRPFLYIIREQRTGLILFIGQMDEPK